MNAERTGFRDKALEFSKKLDVVQIIGGGIIAVFNPVVGAVIVAGSTITYFVADKFQSKPKQFSS